MSFNKFLEKTIQKSQHCNRNWDLSKSIPEDDVKTMVVSVTECSSKQNRVFYKPIFITNREIIENVHKKTVGFWGGDGHPKQPERYMTNSQTLANLLVAFVRDRDLEVEPRTDLEVEKGVIEGKTQLDEDRSLGIAAGYLTLTANMLGYDTGCCQCISDPEGMKKDLGTDEDVLLLMGVGYRDNSKSRLEHHEDDNFKFPSFKKEIKVDYIS